MVKASDYRTAARSVFSMQDRIRLTWDTRDSDDLNRVEMTRDSTSRENSPPTLKMTLQSKNFYLGLYDQLSQSPCGGPRETCGSTGSTVLR